MLFRNRLEIWNPGCLPNGLTPEKLRKPHNSVPANLLLAEPMYLSGYIERMGTGTGDIIRWCRNAGLQREPEFVQEDIFKTIIWRKAYTGQATGQATGQVYNELDKSIERIVRVMPEKEIKRSDLQEALGMRHRESFVNNYLDPAIEKGFIRMKFPNNPNHPYQRYMLTEKGFELKKEVFQSGFGDN